MNYSSRLAKLRAAIGNAKCDALLVSDLANVRYLCGYSGSSGLIVVTKRRAFFITDFRYQTQAKAQVPSDYDIVIAERGLWREAARRLNAKAKKGRVHRVGFESEHVTVAAWDDVSKLLKLDSLATRKIVEELRVIKDADEITLMRRAAEIVDEAFAHILTILKPGISELEIADELLHQMKARGASGTSFDTIVASGPRSALPHGVASERVIGKKELVTIDMGAVYNGYCSDCTRTVCVGKADSEQKKIYALVWDAQVAAQEALRPGLKCVDADKIARDIITQGGYEKAFGHGLGHGVGMEIHEAPRLSKLGKGKLREGMIVTCEPGIYLDDWGGVRIEEMCAITASGADVLSRASKPRDILEV